MTSLCSEIRAIRLDSYHQNYVVPLKELLNNKPVKDKHSELKMIFRVSSGKLCSNRFSHLIGMKKAQTINCVQHLEFQFDDTFHKMSVKDCRSFLQNVLRSFSGLRVLTIKRLVEFDSCTDLI